MTDSLEDLVRDTLAVRAHDVDGVELTIHPPAPHHGRRWVAIGTVAAVAAAVLVAIVLVAPWREAPRRGDAAVTPATPPAGMQWVSFHGLTLTVPDSWALVTSPCQEPTTDAVYVDVAPDAVHTSTGCGFQSETPPPRATMTSVSLGVLGDGASSPLTTTFAGHPAGRSEMTLTSDPPQYSTVIEIPDLEVRLQVTAHDSAAIDPILDAVTASPVDAYGCTARLPGDPMTSTAPGRPVLPAGGEVTLCQYEPVSSTSDGTGVSRWLVGSRLLTPAEAEDLRGLVSRADPDIAQDYQQVLGPDYGVRVFHATQDDGTTAVIVADPSSGTVAISDGTHSGVVPGSTLADLPKTYP